jgi:palmitoyl-[glycerolipid] 3-(E)-desaturase
MMMLSPRALKIQKLNARVTKLTKDAVEAAATAATANTTNGSTTTTNLPPHILRAQQPMTVLQSGAPIYQLRSATLVYGYCLLSMVLLTVGASQLHPLVTVLGLVTVFLGYDLYSGVLHVVFDHPENVHLPLIGQPCLEFQWHHWIPDDLVRKDFVDVCGDLNVVVAILMVVNLYLLDITNPLALFMGGMKIFMAYFGQFSHRSAHTHSNGSSSNGSSSSSSSNSSTRKSSYSYSNNNLNSSFQDRLMQLVPSTHTVASTLQSAGLMISRKDHAAHHKEPYDLDFCLIGVCNPIIDFARNKITTNNTVWLIVFAIWSIFDLMIYVKLVDTLVSAVVTGGGGSDDGTTSMTSSSSSSMMM